MAIFDFNVPEMGCEHCERAVIQACKTVDPAARVEVDLDAHRVVVESAKRARPFFAEAMTRAGFAPGWMADPADDRS